LIIFKRIQEPTRCAISSSQFTSFRIRNEQRIRESREALEKREKKVTFLILLAVMLLVDITLHSSLAACRRYAIRLLSKESFIITPQHQEVTTMFSNHINRSRSGFIVGAITWLMFLLPCGVFAQSPLTVQPSTGRVGIGNTNPSEALDVTGTVKATAFQGDGSQLTNLPIGGSADTADVQIFTTPGTHDWVKPLNAKQVFVYLVGGGGGGGSGPRVGGDGGGGGGAGARSTGSWPGAVLQATEVVTVGTGGTGGAAIGTDNTIGQSGTDRGSTTFGSWLRAGGGGHGFGGNELAYTDGDSSSYSNGGPGGGGTENGGTGEMNSTWQGTGVIQHGTGLSAGGGGAGGAFSGTTISQAKPGGQGGPARGVVLNGGGAGASGPAPTAGVDGDSAAVNEASGGGGGARISGGAAAAGGDGGNYGGGGGGGGASGNGQLSGKGGDGAPGIAIIVSIF
jgi:hypothetical protein